MPRYSVAGLTLASDLELPELLDAEVPADGERPSLVWTVALAPAPPPGQFETLLNEGRDPDDTLWLAIWGDGDRYLLRFPGLADFVVTPSKRRVVCAPDEGVAGSTLRHLLLDQVVPRVLAMDGSLVLHASAVALPQGAVAFIGPSGAGKSSLAASFTSQGFPLLCDDFLHLSEQPTGFLATAAYPGLRLWPDAVERFAGHGTSLAPVADYTVKRRLVVEKPIEGSHALVAIVMLGDTVPDEGVPFTLTRLPGREGFLGVFQQAFRMERFGRERILAEFDRVARLSELIPVMRLEHRRDYGLLPAIRAEIIQAIDDLAESGRIGQHSRD